jgi:hypothetical protein
MPTYINEHGQTVSEVLGQPGRVITGRPQHVEIVVPADPFATIPPDDDLFDDTAAD